MLAETITPSASTPTVCPLCSKPVAELTNWSICRRCVRRQRLPSAESMKRARARRQEAGYLRQERDGPDQPDGESLDLDRAWNEAEVAERTSGWRDGWYRASR